MDFKQRLVFRHMKDGPSDIDRKRPCKGGQGQAKGENGISLASLVKPEDLWPDDPYYVQNDLGLFIRSGSKHAAFSRCLKGERLRHRQTAKSSGQHLSSIYVNHEMGRKSRR